MKKIAFYLFFVSYVSAEGEQSWYFSSYRDTCSACVMKNDVLECMCPCNDGRCMHKTRLHRVSECPLDIANCNGALACGRCQ